MRKAAGRIVQKLRLHGHEAFFAGGWVRDFLLRRKPQDIDIATSALPDEVLRLFPKSRAVGAHFGVIQVRMYGHDYEVATFRSDHAYLDGRHPSSVTFCGPQQDAVRRDFTINGLFYDPASNRIIDYVRGRNDIQNRIIRTIGDPHLRFAEDKLRMLRALRLACSLGFQIFPETWEAIRKLAPEILQVSWERIRDELLRLLTGPDPGAGLDLLDQSGLLHPILPEVAALHGIQHAPGVDAFAHTRETLALLRSPSAVLAVATLLHDTGKSANAEGHALAGMTLSEQACRRLKMSNAEIDQVADLVASHTDFGKFHSMSRSIRTRLLRKPNIADHLELFRINSLSNRQGSNVHANWLEELERHREAPPFVALIRGEDLMELGYSPGPVFKEILRSVEDLQLEGVLKTREEAIRHIQSAYPRPGASI